MSSANRKEEVPLESWKEIANYLGVDVRTAQRYEQRDQLPVIRDMRGTRGSVRARKEEIDTWVRERRLLPAPESHAPEPGPAKPNKWKSLWLVAATVVVAGFAAAVIVKSVSPKTTPPLVQSGRLFARAEEAIHLALADEPVISAFHPDGKRLFVTSRRGQKIWMLSTDSWKITATIPLGSAPGQLFFDEDGSKIYSSSEKGIDIVDGRTLSVQHVTLSGPQAQGLAIAGDRLYAAQGRSGMTRMHLPTGRMEEIPGLICPMFPLVDVGRGRMYVSCRCGGPGGRPGHDAIDVIDLKTERSIRLASGPPLVGDSMVPKPALDHLCVNGSDACRAPYYDHVDCPVTPGSVVHLYRTSDGVFVKSLGWPEYVANISVHPDGRRAILATDKDGGALKVLSTSGFHVLEELPVPGLQSGTVSPDGRYVAATLPHARSVVVFRAQVPDCEPAKTDLLSFWSGDGTFDDALMYHLRPVGTVTFAPGRQGSAFRFGPEPGHLVRTTGASPYEPVENGTLAVWVNPEASSGPMPIFSFPDPNQPGRWDLRLEPGGRLKFELQTDPKLTLFSEKTIPAGAWTHVAIAKSKQRIALFVNGRLEASSKHSPEIPLIGFVIGTDHHRKSFFRGMMDEVVRYGRGLNPSDMQQLYELPGRMNCAGGRSAEQ